MVADSTRALRMLETSHPPVLYVPPGRRPRRASCARAPGGPSASSRASRRHLDVVAGGRTVAGAGPGPTGIPRPRYEALRDHVAFYPGRMDACWLDDERVQPQAGDFYGGWVTADLRGPFKGGPGTAGW